MEKIQRDYPTLRWPTGGPRREFSLSAEVQKRMRSASECQDLGRKDPQDPACCTSNSRCRCTTLDRLAFTSWLPTLPRVVNPLLKSPCFFNILLQSKKSDPQKAPSTFSLVGITSYEEHFPCISFCFSLIPVHS